jgi:hypothetical protein
MLNRPQPLRGGCRPGRRLNRPQPLRGGCPTRPRAWGAASRLTQNPAREDFRKVIAAAIAECDVFLAVIGKQWAAVKDKKGARRLDNPGDFVRLETEAALKRKIPVIPVLVGGAKMPDKSELPESISGLADRQAVELSDSRWAHDVGRLLEILRKRAETTAKRKEAAASIRRLESMADFWIAHKPGDVVAGQITGSIQALPMVELAEGVIGQVVEGRFADFAIGDRVLVRIIAQGPLMNAPKLAFIAKLG